MTNKKTVLITGASSGIGLSLAKIFAREGYALILVARQRDKLEELAKTLQVSVTVIPKDLSLPDSPREIFDELSQKSIPVDILVNNAGFGTYGRFTEIPVEDGLQMLQVNMVALTHLTRLFLPAMIKNKDGKILNVASTAAFQPGPLMAGYYASKAYVVSFSEALAFELKSTGVTVTALCPGPTRTEFQARANMKESKLFTGSIMDADTVAEIGYKGLMQGKRVVIPGFNNKFMAFLSKVSPNSIVMQIIYNMQKKRVK